MLGFSNAWFFLALLAIQVPVGILFDAIGARLTVALLAAVAVAGSLMHWVAVDGAGLSAARFLLGLGHGGNFMATVFLVSRWYPRALVDGVVVGLFVQHDWHPRSRHAVGRRK